MLRLKNEVALITGSSRGIGKEIAVLFAKEGATVIINGLNSDNVAMTVNELREKGYKAEGSTFDTTDRQTIFLETKRLAEKYGDISILVNNAGISPKKNGRKVPIKDMEFGEWAKVLDVNINGVFNCCQAVIPGMITMERGKIINMTSAFAKRYNSIAPAHYVTTKAAVIGLTHALCGELAGYGINCNAIAPGRAWTEMTRFAPKEINDGFMKEIPSNRFAETSDIAYAALYLASEESSYVNGATIDVNGGFLMT